MLDNRLKVFVAVCETRGYQKAADKLFISQPAVSHHIRNLEQEMGTKLIVFRKGQLKLMQLTKHGEILFKYCKQVVKQDKQLQEELAQNKNYVPPFEPYKIMTKLYEDPDYIMGKRLSELVSSIAETRSERDRLYNALRDDPDVRKKVFDSGQRRFYYYHTDDVKKYIEDMRI
ncbi:LysR family transcriptional regulator [Lacrimispora celerecrescens]|uniref:Regulatory helix-turn-helix LysR family protein n=1 Tax=[Clostridium] celerecrescens 18A TaxID=1286362 RepID=A0A2M8Z2V9_9FIRM|nr:LysR family transcriptional regulator [Lacrimispora celerecrescens]PJJ27772.1 regulatory helix-turn-helix LysR family protein [[Clostridium] celerecrescens 18A]